MRISDWSSDVCSSDLAVAEGDHEVERLVLRRALLGVVDQPHDVLRQPRALADHPEADAVLVELGDLALQVAPQQAHEVLDLAGRAAPVLGGKAEDRKSTRLNSSP